MGLLRDEVVNYLLECKRRGWCQEVYEEHAASGGGGAFVIRLSLHKDIFIRHVTGPLWDVLYIRDHYTPKVGYANTLERLEQTISQAATLYGISWPEIRTSGRLSESTPASNVATISGLIGGVEIEAVFDPYLDNQSLVTLGNILSFGDSLSAAVRLLSSTKMTQGTTPRLTKSLVADWFTERGITAGEVRLLPPSEHRRFMLLKGGQSLLLGMSLNAIAKNEAVYLDSDREDRPFFDTEWAKATPL
jgi:hypothetical protein